MRPQYWFVIGLREPEPRVPIATIGLLLIVFALVILGGAPLHGGALAPKYSANRWVYCIGDPSWNPTGVPGWWMNTTSSTGWTRDAAGQDAYLTPQRVYFDDSVRVMQSVGGSYGNSGSNGSCRTAAVRIDGTDPSVPGVAAGAQGASLRHYTDAYRNVFFGPPPNAIPKQGQTWWYGFGAATNPEYVAHGQKTFDPVFGNWNSFGLQFHQTTGILGPVMQEIATVGPATRGALRKCNGRHRRLCRGPNGSVRYPCNQSMSKLAQPRLQIALSGGQNDATTDDAVHTCRRILGPRFRAGKLYRSIYQVKWDSFHQGFFRWWVDSGDGRGYVQYANVSGISTLWRSGTSPDMGTYPQLLNYRKTDSSLPAAITYYGGFIRGSTMTDVAIP